MSTVPKRSSRGFTLVELLVVIAIIGILVALLLPAVQAAREAARRMQCSNNLRQFGLALQNHHGAKQFFPASFLNYDRNEWLNNNKRVLLREGEYQPGKPYLTNHSWIVQLLPYIEEQTTHDRIDFDSPANDFTPDNVNMEIRAIPLNVARCPSDSSTEWPGGEGFAPTNYVGCYGNTGCAISSGCENSDDGSTGFMHISSYTAIRRITDGTSSTIGLSECLVNRPWVRRVTQGNLNAVLTGTSPDIDQNLTGWGGRGASWFWAFRNHSHGFTTFTPPNDSLTSNHEPEVLTMHGYFAARSDHPGGVHGSMLDGSIRFVNNDIDILAWRAMGSMAGGEVISP